MAPKDLRKVFVEEQPGEKVGGEVRPWLVEWVGWLMSRAEVGADGETGYDRCKGKEARLPVMEFGEGVKWKRRRQGEPLGTLSCMWEDGIYIGAGGKMGEGKFVNGRKGSRGRREMSMGRT